MRDFEALSDGLIKTYCDLHVEDNASFKKNAAAAKVEFRDKFLASKGNLTASKLDDKFVELQKYLESDHANMNRKVEKAYSARILNMR